MSIYHLSLKTVSRGDGRSITAAAAYRSGEKITDELSGEVHDYTRKSGVIDSFIMAPEGAPEWVQNREELWNKVEKSETKKDGGIKKNARLGYEIELGLQNELSMEENIEMVKEFVKENLNDKGFTCDVAIHTDEEDAKANGKDPNPHAHILIVTRGLSQDGFDKKIDRDTLQKSGFLKNELRPNWEEKINHKFEEKSIKDKVSSKSLQEQGIDRKPQTHLGPFLHDIFTKVMDENAEFKHGEKLQKYGEILQKSDQAKKHMNALEYNAIQEQITELKNQQKEIQKPVEMEVEKVGFAEDLLKLSDKKKVLGEIESNCWKRIREIKQQLDQEKGMVRDVKNIRKRVSELEFSKTKEDKKELERLKEILDKKEENLQSFQDRKKVLERELEEQEERKNETKISLKKIHGEIEDLKRKAVPRGKGKSKNKSKGMDV